MYIKDFLLAAVQYIFFSFGNITLYATGVLLSSFHVLDEHTVYVAWEIAGRCGIELHDVGYVYYLLVGSLVPNYQD